MPMCASRAAGVLKDVFGYDSFRPMQEEIIETLLKKQDALVIMPTGGGKSLCYQIPAILFPGLTLVVSPLISLMQDQVQQLQAQGVAAEFLNSSLKAEDYRQVMGRIYRKELVMLYLAPETLMKDTVQEMLQQVEVDCITIDEAHCISEWGHDFRPEYRMMSQIRQSMPEAVCVALTATATEQVQEDIRKSLNLRNDQIFITSFDRKNLFLQVDERETGLSQLLSFVRGFPDQSGIVYCFSRKKVDQVTAQLEDRGFSVKPYHAGLSDSERQQNQDLFIRDDVQIIVATIAFGMGINKPNVRFVVHYDLPKNVESYYQQIGRAGRDSLDSHCLLLFKDGDKNKQRFFIDQMEDTKLQRVAMDHLDHMVDYAESFLCRRKELLRYFGEEYPEENCGSCDNCVNRKSALEDVTVEAQKFLSCIARTEQRFGAAHIIDILRGSNNQKIRDWKHDQLTTYGIGESLSKKQWSHLSRQFIRQGLISKDPEHGSLKLSAKTGSLFRGELKVEGTLISDHKHKSAKKDRYADLDYSREAFDKLRQRRKELATAENVPPYVIFSDKTLIEMAQKKPRSRTDLLAISGVGLKKLEKYGEPFLKALHGDEMDFSGIFQKDEEEKSRTEKIGDMFNEGMGLGGLQEHFRMKNTALIGHLISYQEEFRLLDKEMLEKTMNLEPALRNRIAGLIETLGESRLKQIQQELGDQVNMNQLKILLLWLA